MCIARRWMCCSWKPEEGQSRSLIYSACFTTFIADAARIAELEAAVARLQGERGAVSRMRADLEKAALRLEQERNAWQKTAVS